ncbi:MAG: glycosyltransferase family 1 protein [Sedimenticola sp.]
MTLRIAINAQLDPATGVGGVSSFLIALVAALGKLNDGDEEYLIVMTEGNTSWLEPYLGPNQQIVTVPSSAQDDQVSGKIGWLDDALRPLVQGIRRLLCPGMERIERQLGLIERQLWSSKRQLWWNVPVSDGLWEGLGCQVVHFPFQEYEICALPTVYNPHDLQHLHYPEFFNASDIARREAIYPAGCRFSKTVVVASDWVKSDVLHHYGVHEDKVQVIPWAAPTQAYGESTPEVLEEVRSIYGLTEDYAFYPAMTWEHKNHIRLLQALALVRERDGRVVNLVCTGFQHNQYWERIQSTIEELELQSQVHFLGFVPEEHLKSLYRLAQFVIAPTLFEASCGPVFEAWQEEVPVACSTVTSLPEQVGDGALLFDALSVEEIADTILRMTTDEPFRRQLTERGSNRLACFSWERTAKAYRAVYRRAARMPLNTEDKELLNWNWMKVGASS